MKKFGVFALLLAVLCLSGCGVSSMVSNNVTETQVVLSQNNFNIVGQASGHVTSTYFIGLGGIGKKSIRGNAIDQMTRNAKLKGAQTLTNITTKTSYKMITPLIIQMTCSATANIIEFK